MNEENKYVQPDYEVHVIERLSEVIQSVFRLSNTLQRENAVTK